MTTAHVTKTGRKTWKKGVTTEKRREEVKQLFASLAEWKEQQSPELIAEAFSAYDGYSQNNALLIAMQRPNATDVDAHGAWKERGRIPVGKNTGIKIVYPAGKWTEPNPNDPANPIEHVYFGIRYVYDVATTIERGNTEDETDRITAKWRADHPNGWEVKDDEGNILY
jgi:hypothetical protein